MPRKVYPSDRRRWFRVESRIGHRAELEDNDLLALWIRILAECNERRAQDSGGKIRVSKAELCRMSGKHRADVALKSARLLADVTEMSLELDGEVVVIGVHNWMKIQGVTPTELRRHSDETPATTPTPTPTPTKYSIAAEPRLPIRVPKTKRTEPAVRAAISFRESCHQEQDRLGIPRTPFQNALFNRIVSAAQDSPSANWSLRGTNTAISLHRNPNLRLHQMLGGKNYALILEGLEEAPWSNNNGNSEQINDIPSFDAYCGKIVGRFPVFDYESIYPKLKQDYETKYGGKT